MRFITILASLFVFAVYSASAQAAQCFSAHYVEPQSTLQAVIEISNGPYSFSSNKCLFEPYFDGHDGLTSANCASNTNLITLDKGYSSLGVMLRGSHSTPRANIAAYEWKIYDGPTTSNTVLATYDSWHAPFVFENTTASDKTFLVTLKVTDTNGTTSTASKPITVWSRLSKPTYYVDSVNGDDRFTGTSASVVGGCNVSTQPPGTCVGPWRTATQAFVQTLSPRAKKVADAELDGMDMCALTDSDAFRYYPGPQAVLSVYRGRRDYVKYWAKDSAGKSIPAKTITYCKTLNGAMSPTITPGSRILFNRGQTFKFDPTIYGIYNYTADDAYGNKREYKALIPSNVVAMQNNSSARGIYFGAYGSGSAPVIKNQSIVPGIALNGASGMFHLTLEDLKFDLESQVYYPFPGRANRGNRAVLFNASGTVINLVINRVELANFEQGPIMTGGLVTTVGSTTYPEHATGLYIFNSWFHHSNVTHFYTQNGHEDVGVVGSIFEWSQNHLIYSSTRYGVILWNTLKKPRFGRTAYRLAGSAPLGGEDAENWIGHNTIEGWIDPCKAALDGRECSANGDEWNYSITNFSPNVADHGQLLHGIKDTVIADNTISGCQNCVNFGNTDGVRFMRNSITTADTVLFWGRINLNDSLSTRPAKNLTFQDNVITDTAASSVNGMFLQLENYASDACDEQADHSGITVKGNTFIAPGDKKILGFAPLKQAGTTTLLSRDAAQAKLPGMITFANNIFQSGYVGTRKPILFGGNVNLSTTSPASCTTGNPPCDGSIDMGGGVFVDWRLYGTGSTFYNTLMGSTTLQ